MRRRRSKASMGNERPAHDPATSTFGGLFIFHPLSDTHFLRDVFLLPLRCYQSFFPTTPPFSETHFFRSHCLVPRNSRMHEEMTMMASMM